MEFSKGADSETRLMYKGLLGNVLGINIYGQEGKEAELNRGRSWGLMKSQWRPHLALRSSEAGYVLGVLTQG